VTTMSQLIENSPFRLRRTASDCNGPLRSDTAGKGIIAGPAAAPIDADKPSRTGRGCLRTRRLVFESLRARLSEMSGVPVSLA
jgi:hypothetical protein